MLDWRSRIDLLCWGNSVAPFCYLYQIDEEGAGWSDKHLNNLSTNAYTPSYTPSTWKKIFTVGYLNGVGATGSNGCQYGPGLYGITNAYFMLPTAYKSDTSVRLCFSSAVDLRVKKAANNLDCQN